MKYRTLLTLLVAAAASKLSAITYTATSGTTFAGGSFSATNGTVVTKSYPQNGNVTILGVSTGVAGAEVDLNQSLTIKFDTPQWFDYLTIGLLFDGPEYGDKQEIAAAFTSPFEFRLQALTANTADWSLAGTVLQTVVNPGTSVVGGMGVWKIVNPFGSLLVSELKLYPITTPGQGKQPSDSDFGLVAFKTPDVASTFALAGLTLAGLGLIARRKS